MVALHAVSARDRVVCCRLFHLNAHWVAQGPRIISWTDADEHPGAGNRFPGRLDYNRAMVEPSEVEALLRKAFPDASVLELQDLTGTKDHYEATVVSASFEGMSRVAQHQAVYGALAELMKGPIHALALHTFTPRTYAARKIG